MALKQTYKNLLKGAKINMVNPDQFNIVSENSLTEVLAHFNSEFILSIIDQAIANRHNPSAYLSNPNVVDAWDMNFKNLIAYYQTADITERITVLRIDTYKEIIDRICKYHSFNFTIDEVDLYTVAHYLYQIFVSDFLMHMDTFFANYIVANADGIYMAMDLGNMKKNKDTSTVYAKKIFNNPSLAIISANIDAVVTYICGMDISLDQILMGSGLDKQVVDYILTLISDQDNFFKNHFVTTIMDENVKPIHLNNIRFIIRNIAGVTSENISQIAIPTTDIIDPPLV